MKKLNLLVMPLMAISLLVSCNNGGGDKPGEVKFSLSSDHPIEVVDKTATVYVDWTPTDTIRFSSFIFTASPAKENTVTFEQTGDPRPMSVKITFNEDITTDISGTLSFAYEDVTAKAKGNSSVNVTIPKADPHYVNKEEYNLAASLEGVEYLQTETTRYDEKKVLCDFSPSIYYMYAETTSRERFVVKSGDSYSKYTHLFNEGEEFKHEEAEASEFMTPQTRDDINPKKLLDSYSIVYGEDLHYDSSRGVYVARIEALGKSIAFELTFNNKKVTNMSIFHNDTIDEVINYVYEEKTPVLPCALNFSSETCELKTTDESKVITAPVIVHNGTTLNYKIVAKSGHVLPLANQIDFKITETKEDFEGEHSYNPNTGEVSITLTDNVTITCQGGVDPSLI